MRKILLITLNLFLLFSCKKELLHSVQEEQANDIITLLSEYGINADKIPYGSQDSFMFKIVVDEDNYSRSWNILKENGLPREKIRGLSDVYQKQGLISSSTEERALLIQAIKGEVEKTLETIDNVIKARVIISISNTSQNPFTDSKEPISASVLLKIKKGSYVNKDSVREILMGAVSSLNKDRIAVEVVESSSPSVQKLVQIAYLGPFRVSESTARTIYTLTIGFLFITFLSLMIFTYYFYRKRATIRDKVEEY